MSISTLDSALQVVPTGAALGAEIRGVDISQGVDAESFARIHAALCKYEVLIFRDQNLTPPQQVAFGRLFGELKTIPFGNGATGCPELYIISNVLVDGKPIGSDDAGRYWHTDGAYLEKPHLASMLYALEVPVVDGQVLGDTLFSSQSKAFETLPAETRDVVTKLHAIHSLENRYEKKRIENNGKRNEAALAIKSQHPPVTHPVIRTNPISGARCLYVTEGYTASIEEMPGEAGNELLRQLCEHSVQPSLIYRHSWKVGDLVVWDNGSTVHRATFDYPRETRRLMHRATVAGR